MKKSKKFIGTVMLVVTTMLALVVGIGTFILGFRILQLLFNGSINPILCLEFVGFAIMLGLLIAGSKVFGEMCDVEVKIIDTDPPEYKVTEEDKRNE